MSRQWLGLGLCLLVWSAGCSKTVPEEEREISKRTVPEVTLDNLDPPQAELIREARAKVEADPESGDAWGRLGQSLHAVDYFKAAIECYQHAAALDPNAPRWPYLLGVLELQDEPESGLFHLRRAVQLVDVHPDTVRLSLARALIERGQEEEARPHLRRLLDQHPDHPAARLEQARVNLLAGSLESAVRDLSPCLTNAYTSKPALLLMAQIRQRQGQPETASALAQRAAEMPTPFAWPDPFLREVMRLRIDRAKLQDHINGLLMGGRFPDAEAALQQLLSAFPEDAEGLLLLGRLRYLQRRCQDAEVILRQHLSVQPQSLNGIVQLALALLCQQRWDDGADMLRQAVSLKPDFAEAHYNLGFALARGGHFESARQSYEEALRCRPGYVDAHVALAEEWLRADQADKAEEHLQKALALDPTHEKARRLANR